MKRTRARNSREPDGLLENTLYTVVNHWKWELSALSLFLMAVYVVCIIADAAGNEKPPKYLPVEMVLLTDKGLETWCRSAEFLASLREKQRLVIPGRSLEEFIAWGRRNPDVLAKALDVNDPEVFLGLTLSIANVRRSIRDMVEHDMRLEESLDFDSKAIFPGDFSDRFQIQESFELEVWENDALNVYDANSELVESALDQLLPDQPPLIPYWKVMDDAELVKLGLMEEEPVESRPVSWRVISRSRYGPRILRGK